MAKATVKKVPAALKRPLVVQLRKGRVRYYYAVKSGNGKVMVHSQKYFSKSNAERAGLKTANLLNARYEGIY